MEGSLDGPAEEPAAESAERRLADVASSRVRIDDIAAVVGLGRATVSRALNGRSEVSSATRDRVLHAAAELGYVPTAAAHALRTGRTRCLGLLLPSVRWPWIVDVLQGVTDRVAEAGYTLVLYSTAAGESAERDFVERALPSRPVDGLLLVVPPGMLGSIRDLARHGMPVVVLDDRGHRPDLPSVSSADADGGRIAARHLLGLGRRRIAVITGPMDFGCCQERLAGYRAALGEAGIPYDEQLVVRSDFRFDGGRAAIEQLDRSGQSYDAVFAMNDLMALGALTELGDRVPHDVSVVGFDDIEAASLTRPALTTVHQPLYELGETAVRMVLDAIDSTASRTAGAVRERVELPVRLVVRESCGSRGAAG